MKKNAPFFSIYYLPSKNDLPFIANIPIENWDKAKDLYGDDDNFAFVCHYSKVDMRVVI